MKVGDWVAPERHRNQMVIMAPSLDEMIPRDHPVRLLDQLLERLDWTEWESRYDRRRGRAAIHPRRVAGAILLGLTRRLRSTRQLEDATRTRLDFIWLLHGMTIDHSTFAGFRKRFDSELRSLFRQIARLAVGEGAEAGIEIAIDGTRVRADSSRTGALTIDGLERRGIQVAEALCEALDKLDGDECGDEETLRRLEAEVASLQAQLEKLERAEEQARIRDEAKAERADRRCADKTRVPLADPDSYVMPNKEGGKAPNYTPTAATDTATGAIVSADVVEGGDEASAVEGAVGDVEEITGAKPASVSCDSAFPTGPNLEALEAKGIDVYAPAGLAAKDNPAVRPDPTVPVAEKDRDRLPTRGRKSPKFTRDAFLYDAERDLYHCPMGREMPFDKTMRRRNSPKGPRLRIRLYRCAGCGDCPLAPRCLSPTATARTVRRDPYQHLREKLRERMATPEAQAVYRRRAPVAEGTFAGIKHVMGVRRFLVRGRQAVRTEWLWICCAYNVRKLLARGLAAPGGGGGDAGDGRNRPAGASGASTGLSGAPTPPSARPTRPRLLAPPPVLAA